MGRAHLRVVAIDGVALGDAPPLPREPRVEPIDVVRQQREIRLMREELRRLQRRRTPARKR
jgi:hypothetical protein